VRGKAVRRDDVIDQSLNAGKPEAQLDAPLAGIGRLLRVATVRFAYCRTSVGRF
jgi:hypothetical protein